MTEAKGKLYIAYGSNLNLKQMKHRCPTAKVVGKSLLNGWEMTFRGNSSGVATIEPDKNSSVPVLIWQIYPKDEKALDIYEGAPHFYHKENIPVMLNDKTINAMVYIMNNGYPECSPNKFYLNTILEGYQTAGFEPKILQTFVEAQKEEKIMTEKVRNQIMAIRDTGETNMLDTNMVQQIANREKYFELVCYIEEHRREYVNFIITGKES